MNILNRYAAVCLLLFAGCTQAPSLSYTKNNQGYSIQEGVKPVLFFQTTPKTINGKFERSGYVHPLYDWDGNELTQDGPADHPHHRGIFWAWHQVLWKGQQVGDSWVSDKIRFVPGGNNVESGKHSITLHSELTWLADSIDADDKSIIKEKVAIRVHEATENYRLIDFSVTLFALKDSIALGGSDDIKGYGGFSARWRLPKDMQFFSGDSLLQPRETAVTAAPWISFTGTFNGTEKQSVALFCKEAFPGPEQSWILRGPKDISMQNALFPGRNPVLIGRDGLTLSYRLVIQKTPLAVDIIKNLYDNYQKETAF